MKRALTKTLLQLAGLAIGSTATLQAQTSTVYKQTQQLPAMLSNDLTSVRNFSETAEIWRTTPQLATVREHALVAAYFAEYRRLGSIVRQACLQARQHPEELARWKSFADELDRSWDPLEALRVQQLHSTAEALPSLRRSYRQISSLRQRMENQLVRLSSAGILANR
ncbi:hypothetical protein [Hymenobacter sp. DG01]|uniref:hypothetical protein n=1 Tax=Hymenobacter sp. DG01 TaxID=2584940 RepID=UPI001121275E|nr:hypothetical protein [Hymenobacter sp. DG01]